MPFPIPGPKGAEIVSNLTTSDFLLPHAQIGILRPLMHDPAVYDTSSPWLGLNLENNQRIIFASSSHNPGKSDADTTVPIHEVEKFGYATLDMSQLYGHTESGFHDL